MKAAMPEIAANNALRLRLFKDILGGRFAHAYIIEGAVGSGRHLFALNIAKALACENRTVDGLPLPCNHCEACRRIGNNISPDIITVRREGDKAGLGVEAARFIRSDVRTVPNDLDIKVYIIEDADKLTAQAQNALLLTLEEPPAYALFFLLCERADSLLETVRSRAPTLRTEPVPYNIMSSFLLESAPEEYSSAAQRLHGSSEAEFNELLTAADGSIGKAYELLNPEKRTPVLEARAQVRKFVDAVLNGNSGSVLYATISEFPQKREELIARLELIMLALRDLLILKKSEDAPLCFYSYRNNAIEHSELKSTTALLRLCSACETAVESLRHNANIRLTLTQLATVNPNG